MGYTDVRCWFLLICFCLLLEILRKSKAWTKRGYLYGKSHWKWLRWACKLHWVGSQLITRAGWTMLARVMETQISCLVRSGFSKGAMPSASISVWEKAAPSALALMPARQFSFFLHVPDTFPAVAHRGTSKNQFVKRASTDSERCY